MNFGEQLKTLRKMNKLTQEQLAVILGLERSSIGKYEGKGNIMPSTEILNSIADYFHVSVDYLLGRGPSANKGIRIPVLGRVAAGIPLEAIEDIIDYEEIPQDIAATGEFFGLQIKGDSMEPRIKDGDVVIVRRQSDIESDEVAVILINGHDATVKKVVKHQEGISLIPFNGSYSPQFFTWGEIESLPVEIVGKVVELRGKF